MDSFYEQPRSINAHALGQINPSPIVPEVSMLFENNVPQTSTSSGDSMLLTYKAWKERNCNNNLPQKMLCTNQFDFKKQVRFEGPTQNYSRNLRHSETNKYCAPLKTKTFEEIYLASIPNRHLDVSVIDSPEYATVANKENVENINPNINLRQSSKIGAFNQDIPNRIPDSSKISDHTGSLEKNKVIDLYNYKRDILNDYKLQDTLSNKQFPIPKSSPSYSNNNKVNKTTESNNRQQSPQPSLNCSNSKSIEVFEKSSDEPTVKDLLKIIQQQNEQLLILQKQVSALLSSKGKPKQLEAPHLFQKYQTSTQIDKPNIAMKRHMPQFSLDVMTSFEVSIRGQQNLNRPAKDNYFQERITEVTETSSKGNEEIVNIESNIKPFTAPLPSIEPAQSAEISSYAPDNIINIDMKDYSSDGSSDDEADDTTNAGWTFYNNIMGQVNDIFKKSGIRPFPVSDKPSTTSEASEDLCKQNVMQMVKQATVKHLKSIGVHVPVMDISDEPVGPNNSNPNNISFAVKQLLMKYLPDEQLAKVTLLQEQNLQPQKRRQPGLIERRPEFSMATLQYMQKYNLLNDENVQQAVHTQRPNQPSSNFERILDITAIRQQPKLL